MKITRTPPPPPLFRPVTITLETAQEVRLFEALVGSTSAVTLERMTSNDRECNAVAPVHHKECGRFLDLAFRALED